LPLTKIIQDNIGDSVVNYLADSYSFRNLVINGSMDIHQRSASVTGLTTGGYHTADRWLQNLTTFGTWTQTVENDAPTGSGLRKSLRILCTTANTSTSDSRALGFEYRFEGQNLQMLKKGTSSAESVTLSFWVKSNVTGTYIVAFEDNDNLRAISSSYTVNTIDVWEYKTITYVGDTIGVLDNDNNNSARLFFWLGTGLHSTGTTLQTSWGPLVQQNRAVGQVNLGSATNNYFQITGVQMEVGSVATPFERRPFEVELQRCMRYYQKSFLLETFPSQNAGRTSAIEFPSPVASILVIPVYLPVVMRTTPSNVTIFNPSATNGQVRNASLNTDCTLTGIGSTSGNKNIYVITTPPASTVAGHTLSFHYTATAEL
jgi:hypothetical protein